MSTAQPRDAKVISLILQSLEVEDAEQNVIHQLLDFAHRYTVDVFQDALLYSEHAGTNEVGLEDVRLAIQGRVNHSFTSPPPKEFLLELAEAKNRVPLPLIPDKYGIRLPPERHCLTAVNFQLIPELPPLGTQSAPDLQDIKPDPDAKDSKETPSLAGNIHFNIKRADSDEEMDDALADTTSSAATELSKNQQNLADHDQWKRKRADDDDNYDD
ncbi:Transcription initiation factor TFIID subunit 9 [Actinomortierella ambigua]|nr:Transcription initiation factor TFIID subunit 9 [Actinomortierella ambigua]